MGVLVFSGTGWLYVMRESRCNARNGSFGCAMHVFGRRKPFDHLSKVRVFQLVLARISLCPYSDWKYYTLNYHIRVRSHVSVTAVQTVKGDRLHGVCSPLFVFVSPVTRRLQRVLTPRLTINNEERAKNKVLREACLVIACLFTADFTSILFVLQFVNKIVNKMNALPVSNLHRATATRV